MKPKLIFIAVLFSQHCFAGGATLWKCPPGATHKFEADKTTKHLTQWCEKNGKKHGPYSAHGEKSTIREMAIYNEGKLTEKFDLTCPQGAIAQFRQQREYIQECFVAKGSRYEKEGPAYSWYDTGQVASKSYYKADKEHGIKQLWFATGQKMHEVQMANGVPDGKETEWDKSGQLIRETHWKNGVGQAVLDTHIPPTPKITHEVINGNTHSRVWRADGTLESEDVTTSVGKFLKRLEYYADGKRIRQLQEPGATQELKITDFFDDGKVESQRIGLNFKKWDKNGRLVRETTAQGTSLQTKIYNSNGVLMRVENYIGPKKNGQFLLYNESGELIVEQLYKDDVLVTSKSHGMPNTVRKPVNQ